MAERGDPSRTGARWSAYVGRTVSRLWPAAAAGNRGTVQVGNTVVARIPYRNSVGADA